MLASSRLAWSVLELHDAGCQSERVKQALSYGVVTFNAQVHVTNVPVNALDAELDALFALSPEAMVQARNELAARLRKAGDKENATRVKALKRPTVSAWILNQLHFHEPDQLHQALTQAERVRALHASDNVDRVALRNALSAQQSTITRLVQMGLSRAEAAGLPHGLAQQKKLLAMVQGFLSGAAHEPPGRMTEDLEPAGFEAVEQVGKSAGTGPERSEPAQEPDFSPARAQKLRVVADAQALEGARREVAALQQEVDTAEALVARGQERARAAEAALSELEPRLREAEQALEALRAEQAEQRAQLAQGHAEERDARRAHHEGTKRLEGAKRTLEQLTRPR